MIRFIKKIIRNLTNKDLTFYCEINYNFKEKYKAYKELRGKVEKAVNIANDIGSYGFSDTKVPVYFKENIMVSMSINDKDGFVEYVLIVRYRDKEITRIEMNQDFKLESYVSSKQNIEIGKNLLIDYLDTTIKKLNKELEDTKNIYSELSKIKIKEEDIK